MLFNFILIISNAFQSIGGQSLRFSHMALKSNRSGIEYSAKHYLARPYFKYNVSSSSYKFRRVSTLRSINFISKEYITFSPSIKKTSKILHPISGELSYKLATNIVITISVK